MNRIFVLILLLMLSAVGCASDPDPLEEMREIVNEDAQIAQGQKLTPRLPPAN
jgi:hypothetical protein